MGPEKEKQERPVVEEEASEDSGNVLSAVVPTGIAICKMPEWV